MKYRPQSSVSCRMAKRRLTHRFSQAGSALTAHNSQLTAHSSQLTAHSSQLIPHPPQLTTRPNILTGGVSHFPLSIIHYPLTIIALLSFLILFSGCKEEAEQHVHTAEVKTDVLIVYSNGTFMTEDFATIVIKEFEDLYECTVELRNFVDSEFLLDRLISDGETQQADIAIGIASTQIERALRTNIFMAYEPENLKNVQNRRLILDRRHRLIPYNYDYYAFVYDTDIISTPPQTFGEMQSSIWNHKIMVTDPRISTTGQGLLLWSLGIFGERGFEQFWNNLKGNFLIVSWSLPEAYIAFQAGEAPVILSYVTTPIHQVDPERAERFRAFVPQEGSLKEIEFVGILNGSENLYLARRFVDFMLSVDFQQHIPTVMGKFPVIEDVELPETFAAIQIPERALTERIFGRAQYLNDNWAEQWMNISPR